MRQYKTKSGVYKEDQLVIVVWLNPDHKTSKQARALETMTSDDSKHPMAFPMESFSSNPMARSAWKNAFLAKTEDAVFSMVPRSSKDMPVLVPIPVARKAFGWDRFYVPSEYTEK